MKTHLWDSYIPSEISVDIKKKLKNQIKIEIKDDIYNIAHKLRIKPSRLYEYFIYESSTIPLNILLELSKIIDLELSDVENNIILYKQIHVPRKNSIERPRLPIEFDPYLTSIIANLIFDGSVPKDGRGVYYNQKSQDIMNDFIEKIKFVFGDVKYSIRSDHKGILKCSIPRIIGEICGYLYGVNSFGTFDARVPEKIFNFDEEHKMVFILTAIIDEGSITYDGQIAFGVCNKLLCEDVKKLCNDLDLLTTEVKQKSKSNYYYFYIRSKYKFLEIINFVSKKYPLISLRHKECRLKYYFEIKKYPVIKTKECGNYRKNAILASLEKKAKTVNQLSIDLSIVPRSLRRHVNYLLNNKKINRKKISKEYIYFIPN